MGETYKIPSMLRPGLTSHNVPSGQPSKADAVGSSAWTTDHLPTARQSSPNTSAAGMAPRGQVPKAASTASTGLASLQLTAAETSALSGVPANQVHGIAAALRKAKIPISQTVVADVMKFHDGSLRAPMEEIGHGKQNHVLRARYDELDAVFRSPRKISQALRKLQHTSSPVREKCSFMLSEALGFSVIPRTVFAVHSDGKGGLTAGVAMAFVSGQHATKVPFENVDITDHGVGQHLLEKKDRLQRNPLLRSQQRFLHGLDDFSFTEDGRVKASYKQSPVDLSTPRAKQELVKLQIVDFLTSQVDRHVKNYLVKPNPDTGDVDCVQGIDNDMSLGAPLKPIAVAHHRMKYGGTSTIVGLPDVVDQDMFHAVMKMTHADIASLYQDLLPPKKIQMVVDNLDALKQHLLSLPPENIIGAQDWDSVDFTDKRKSYVARDAAKPGLPTDPQASVPPRPSLKKTGVKALAGAINGHVWLRARSNHSVAKPVASFADHITTRKMQKRIGDAKALPREVEEQIRNIYSQAEFWHGTGRYQYAAGRSQAAGQAGETVDVLQGILQSGQLRPAEEKLNIVEQAQKSISLTPARMYARTYADSHAADLEHQPRYGSSLLWAGAYHGDTSARLAQGYRKLDSQTQRTIVENTVGNNGLDAWARKVRRSGLVVPPPSAETITGKSQLQRATSMIKPGVAVAEIYQRGSDIADNYPILFGIKKGSVNNKLDIGEALALYEVRSADPLPLSEAITHLEVPRAKVQETKELLASRNLAHLPVLATEDCEAFLSRFNAKHVHAHDLSREARREPPYAVTGPTSLDPSFASAVDIASPDLPADRFHWERGVKYSAGLIPMRRGEDGQLEVFLVKRSNLVLKDRRKWATPGGSCSPGKDASPLVSAMRETREEVQTALTGKVELRPVVLSDAQSNRRFYGYPWLVDPSFRPRLQWENTDSKWVRLAEIEPQSPELMGECAAVLRRLAEAYREAAASKDDTNAPAAPERPAPREQAGTDMQITPLPYTDDELRYRQL
nr:NUDIX hydrolase [uncultured Caldimonas sp.]